MSHDAPPPNLLVVCSALAFVAALQVAAAWLLLRFVLGDAPAATLPPPYPGIFAAVAAAALVAAPLAEGRLMRDAGGDRRRAYVRAKVVGFVLRTLVAVDGLLLALGTGRLAWSAALSMAALIAMALAWPRAADLEGGR